MSKSIQKISEESLRLVSFFNERQPGDFISYEEIEKKSGVVMDERGKRFIKTALNRLKREYAVHKGKGIELASPENGLSIICNRLTRIDNAVRRGDKTTRNIQRSFLSAMDDKDRKTVLYLGAVFGAIRLAAEQGKIAFSKKQELPAPNIPLPRI